MKTTKISLRTRVRLTCWTPVMLGLARRWLPRNGTWNKRLVAWWWRGCLAVALGTALLTVSEPVGPRGYVLFAVGMLLAIGMLLCWGQLMRLTRMETTATRRAALMRAWALGIEMQATALTAIDVWLIAQLPTDKDAALTRALHLNRALPSSAPESPGAEQKRQRF